jgi:cytochrome b pre-mRNA-processing protein 3
LPEPGSLGKMMIFKRLFGKPDPAPRNVYEAIVAAARHPLPYAEWGVPDTLDGRFDLITLHAYLILGRLKGEARQFRQDLVDEVFRDMDRSLRELGVSDVSVGKKVRKMAEVFYGRIAAYDKAIDGEAGDLEDVIRRNIFAELPDGPGAAALGRYMRAARDDLAGMTMERILTGEALFREPR